MAQKVPPRRGREGSRWYNERPTAQEVADWFKTVPLHEGLEHERYIHGIVLIPQAEKVRNEIVGYNDDGHPLTSERTHHTFTAYPKVETRVLYWYDLMALHPDWMGIIEPVGGDPGLPPGFTMRTVTHPDRNGKPAQARFVCCTMRARVYERDTYREEVRQKSDGSLETFRFGKTVIDAPPATKMVGLLGYGGQPDQHSMMKAETGAVGRALGLAGMLVVPGAGVATAEDMREANDPVSSEQAGAHQAALPEEPPAEQPQPEDSDSLRKQIEATIATLKSAHPEEYQQFSAWAREKEYGSLDDLPVPALKGILRKAEKVLDAAQAG